MHSPSRSWRPLRGFHGFLIGQPELNPRGVAINGAMISMGGTMEKHTVYRLTRIEQTDICDQQETMCILTNLCSPARPPKAHLFVQCPRTTATNQYGSIVSHGRICLVNSLNDVSRYHISGKMMKHGKN